MKSNVSSIPFSEIVFAGSIVVIAIAITFSLNSVSCVHGSHAGLPATRGERTSSLFLSLPQIGSGVFLRQSSAVDILLSKACLHIVRSGFFYCNLYGLFFISVSVSLVPVSMSDISSRDNLCRTVSICLIAALLFSTSPRCCL